MDQLDEEFVNHVKAKAISKWRWHNPWIAAILATIHPLGMLYTSVPAFFLYGVAWTAMFFYWPSRPWGVGLGLGLAFGAYAYYETLLRNSAIEKWKHGLSGTGRENPKNRTPIV